MQNILPSIIRTVVPVAVGAIVTLLLKVGIKIDSATVTPLVSGAISAVYYAVVRVAEQKFPQLSWLLGHPAQPSYSTAAPEYTAPAAPLASVDPAP